MVNDARASACRSAEPTEPLLDDDSVPGFLFDVNAWCRHAARRICRSVRPPRMAANEHEPQGASQWSQEVMEGLVERVQSYTESM